LPGLKNIQFERSLEALHPEGLEALAVRQSIFGHFRKGITGAFVSFVADNPQEFWQKSREIDADLQKMKDNKKIAGFASLTSVTSPRTFHLDMRARENIQTVLNRYHLQISSFPGLKALFDQPESRPEPQEAAALTSFKLHQRFFMEDKGEYIGITWVNALSDQVVTDMNNLWKNDDIMVVTLDMALATLMDSARINMYKTVSAAFLLVLVILLVFFRNMTKVMLAMLPMLLGVIVTTGVMGSLGISFNPVNFIILPILIGIGLDDGIHIVDRYRETQDIQKTLISTGRSILLTSLTTCLGFGSLALAKYHVLANMGLLTIVGVLSCFFFSAVLLPALFALRESS
jgi:predicted RND superfamily exporter protein